MYQNINWEIAAGEHWVLIGRSGCGKTSLARIMTGLDRGYSGQLLWNETPYSDLSSLWGVQFQHSALFHELTVFENIIFPMRYREFMYSESFLKDIGMYYAYLIGLNVEVMHKYPHQLSGGQQKLVALARALIKNPPMLLLDEPTAGLDPATALRYDETVKNLTKTTAVVVITHDKERIMQADKIACLSQTELLFPKPNDITIKIWHNDAVIHR